MTYKPELVIDPEIGQFYRATCDKCGKVIESRSCDFVLENFIRHRGTHNGHK